VEGIEKELIKEAKLGNMGAFESLIIRYESKVYNIAYKMFNNEEDAKDVSQEIFIKLYRNLIKFNEQSKFSTWLYRVAVNTCLDEIRKRKKDKENLTSNVYETEDGEIEREIPSTYNMPEAELIKNDRIEKLRYALTLIKEDHRSVIVLKDLEGYSYNEIADTLNITIGTVKSRISRARESLKETLEQIDSDLRQNTREEGM